MQWRYCIRLENLGERTVQLRERNWRIFSLSGTLETVRGRGVVGVEPILSKEQAAFQYSSHVSLQAPSGHMWSVFIIYQHEIRIWKCFQKNREIDGRTFNFFSGALFVWNVTMDTRLTVGFHHFPWKVKEMTQTTPQLWEIEN